MITTQQFAKRLGCCTKAIRERIGMEGFPIPSPHWHKPYKFPENEVENYCKTGHR
jgi:hypothetical protein